MYSRVRVIAIKTIFHLLTKLRIVESISLAEDVDVVGMVQSNIEAGARPVAKGFLWKRRGVVKSLFLIHYNDMFMENLDGRWN